jgi:uncharacterized membrane protein (DUF2068 family)
MSTDPPQRERRDRLLPWIAAERAFRAVVLLVIGIVLVTHPHTDWASEISRLIQKLGLNPQENWIRRLLDKITRIGSSRYVVFGLIALAYGALEGAEAYGLWRQRRWGEYLTVIATSLLFIPEVWELTKSASFLKVGAILVNIAVVAYLIWRLRSGPPEAPGEAPAAQPPSPQP